MDWDLRQEHWKERSAFINHRYEKRNLFFSSLFFSSSSSSIFSLFSFLSSIVVTIYLLASHHSILLNCALVFFHLFSILDILYQVPVGVIVLLSIFYGSISIIAVIGNSLVIWIVATTRQMQTVTNLFIANLALADVVIGMFVIPFQVCNDICILLTFSLPFLTSHRID